MTKLDYSIATYNCDVPGCGDFDAKQAKDWCDGEPCCLFCGNYEDVKHTGWRPAKWVSISMYETQQIYGGSEEGGWYYTYGDAIRGTVREFEAGDFPIAALYEEHLQERVSKQRYSQYGYGGFTVRVTAEDQALHFPKQRPYYS